MVEKVIGKSNDWQLKLDKFKWEIKHIFLTAQVIQQWNELSKVDFPVPFIQIRSRTEEYAIA